MTDQRLVGRTVDAAAGQDFLHTVRAPAGDSGHGEQRGKEIRGDAQHTVHQAGIHIHVGAHDLLTAGDLGENAGRDALDGFHQLQLVKHVFLARQRARAFAEDQRAWVGEGIDGVSHAVDQTGAVAGFLVQHLADKGRDLLVIFPVPDVRLEFLKLPEQLPVCAAVLRALQRADGRGDGGIGVRPGGGNGAAGEGGVVAAAVLGVADQTQVEQARLLVGELLVRPDHAQEIFRDGEARLGAVQIQTVVIKIVALDNVSVRNDDGETGDQLDGLAHHVFHGQTVRIGVAGVERQHRTPQLVHDVVAGIFEDHVLSEVLRQRGVGVQNGVEHLILLARGELAQQQKVGDLGEAEALFADVGVHKVGQVVAAVDQAALHGDAVTVNDAVAEDVADLGAADHDAGAVVVSQAALDVAVFPRLVDQRVMDLVIGA